MEAGSRFVEAGRAIEMGLTFRDSGEETRSLHEDFEALVFIFFLEGAVSGAS